MIYTLYCSSDLMEFHLNGNLWWCAMQGSWHELINSVVVLLKCSWLHTGLLLWGRFHTHKYDVEQSERWLVALPISRMAFWASQIFSTQYEGLDTPDYSQMFLFKKKQKNFILLFVYIIIIHKYVLRQLLKCMEL